MDGSTSSRPLLLCVLLGGTCLAAIAAGPAHLALIQVSFHFICHQIPERCLVIAGYPMPLCARCAGIYFGAFAALMAGVPDRRRWLLAAIALVLLDWSSEALGLRPAWAPLRLFTGLALGWTAAPVVGGAIQELERG